MSAQPEYLDAQAVADQLGIKRKSVYEMLAQGWLPEPDVVWMRHPMWLPETINEWRKHKGKRGRIRVPRRQRIKTKSATPSRPPRVRRTATSSSKAGASRPVEQVVSDQIAAQIASALRQAGHHCTSADVIELAAWKEGDPELEHERERLRQRIVAKLRGLKRQAY